MSDSNTPEQLDAYRGTQRTVWGSGDYADVADRYTWDHGPTAVEAAAIAAGDRVLDVAAGTGNVALRLAELGARATAFDVSPELLAEAGRRAEAEGLELELVEGDAAEMQLESQSFDAVVSVFGVQFAPRQADCAAEIARVLRPGGRIALINWTPSGMIGQVLKTIGGHLPKPPDFVQPPPLWGVPEHVAALFEGTGVETEGELSSAHFEQDSAAGWVDYMAEAYGPMLVARGKLAGAWDGVRGELIEVCERFNTSADGFECDSEFLLSTGSKRA
jgi:SAM-dependent methyltransferase